MGFAEDEITPVEGFIISNHKPGVTEGMTPQEYLLKVKETAREAEILIAKAKPTKLDEDEVVLLHTAYTTSTPIFVVGDHILSPLLETVCTNMFSTYATAVDHIKVNYSKKIIY